MLGSAVNASPGRTSAVVPAMSPGRGADEQANDAEEVAILGHCGTTAARAAHLTALGACPGVAILGRRTATARACEQAHLV